MGPCFIKRISPILYQLLRMHFNKNKIDKKLIIVGVLPTDEDGFSSYRNTDRFITTSFTKETCWMVYDNNKYRNLNLRDRLTKVNQDIIHDLRVLRGDYRKQALYGGIDETDYDKVVSKKGRLLIAGTTITTRDIYNKKISQMIIENCIKNHSGVDLSRVESCSGMLSFINTTTENAEAFIECLPHIYNYFGEPIVTENFKNIAYIDNNKEEQYVQLVISGLPLITDRHNEIVDKLNEFDARATNIYTSPSDDDEYALVDLKGISSIIEEDDDELDGESVDDIFSKFSL